MIDRLPIIDIAPTIYFGREFVGIKAIPHESLTVSATVLREGHEGVEAFALLFDPAAKLFSRTLMRPVYGVPDRYEIEISADRVGLWYFAIEAKSGALSSISERFPIRVERERALVGSWYEFFPRSEGAVRNPDGTITSGTFKSAAKRLPKVAKMGFDVLYIPPIHPIGYAHRKGKNNSLTATKSDPGVPWGIGNKDGGHDAINPELGTIEDFRAFVKKADSLGIEIALDLALQASPDHPWVKSNEEFFTKRIDGTIAYAENPPKKYQDIYPINFDNDYPRLFAEIVQIVKYWISEGVTLFRVDNPHTKPVHFWQELIRVINREHPEIVFLSEAFTNPAMMHALGKAGFQQSYTYFTWRVTKQELIDYGREVAQQSAHFFRPNFWVNTPDILPFHLQSGNPNIFAIRAVLASTLSPSWGMYAGYELFESTPMSDGGSGSKEEYLDSEKYEIKVRDWEGATKSGKTLAPLITRLNEIRRKNVSLQRLRNLHFHPTDSDALIAYSKRDGKNISFIVVNLDPDRAVEANVHWEMWVLGFDNDSFTVTDQLDGKSLTWHRTTRVRLDPQEKSGATPYGRVAHICTLTLDEKLN
ncbi:MAG: maltotransferase domain-containing protein [Candidatus Nanopelagicaceae bacterium]